MAVQFIEFRIMENDPINKNTIYNENKLFLVSY